MACGCRVTCNWPSVVGRPSVHHGNSFISHSFTVNFMNTVKVIIIIATVMCIIIIINGSSPSSAFPAVFLGFNTFGQIFAYVTVF